MKKVVFALGVVAIAAAVMLPGAMGGAAATPGVTAKTISIGGTFPFSGPASSYAPIPVGMKAYFSYVNAKRTNGKRGVLGRQAVGRRPTQVERQREVGIAILGRHVHQTWRVTDVEEPREPAAFRFVTVHREGLEVPSAGMRDVIDAAAERAVVPGVHEVEHERRVHRDRRMQTIGRLPRTIPDAGDIFARPSGRMQRHTPAVARHDMTRAGHSIHFHLQSLD